MKTVTSFLLSLIFTLTFLHASSIEETTQNALIKQGSYQVSGTFGIYDFSDSDVAFDWAFTLSNGTSYQLQGNRPSDDNIFGWKEVNIVTPTPVWYMFFLGEDVDGDGTRKFDWVLLSTDMSNKAAYKLKGETSSGNFDYSKKLDIDYSVDGSNIAIISTTTSDTSLLYNYDEDHSSLYILPVESVNQYRKIQSQLDKARDNKEEFDSILSGFIGSLFLDAAVSDDFASYAPRGEMKSEIVDVINGSVDYSKYLLKADIDFNFIVDTNDLDLLSTALLKGYQSTEYDVNGDGEVNTADIVYLVARFGSEINYYDFYTVGGEKLDIASRSVDDSHKFTYTGSEKQIMVVAKDINGASGFETGLSDSDNVWYRQTGWVLQNSESFISSKKMRRLYSKHGIPSEEFLDKHDIYLLGWSYSVDYTGNVRLPKNMQRPLNSKAISSYFDDIIEMGTYGFSKTDMKHSAKKILTERKLIYTIGALIDQSNRYIETYITTSTYTLNGKVVKVKDILFIMEDLYYSYADKMLVGTIETKPPTAEVKGTVIAERIGPEPKTVEYPVESVDDLGMFGFEDVAFGTYDLNYLDECLCRQALDEDFVFESDDAEPKFTIDMKKVSVTLTLLDRDNNPIAGETISLLAKSCVNSEDDEKSFNAVTDSKGKVVLNNVPIGDYTVFVGDKENSAINVCNTYVGDLYPDPLWNIDITFTGRFCNYEKSLKMVKIANTSDTVKQWPTDNSYPFPLASDYGGKILLDTSYYTGEEYGISLQYHPNGTYNNYNKGLSIFPEVIEEMLNKDRCAGDTWFGDPDAQAWVGINTVFDAAQTAAFYKHEAFTLRDSGEWINDNPHAGQNPDGFSTLSIKFTPAN
jgi:hypothetical protein